MGRSRIGWAASVVAPWCLGAGVLLSITAEAEQEAVQHSGVYDRNGLLDDSDPVRKAIALAGRQQAVGADGTPLPLVPARSFLGDPALHSSGDEIEPKQTLKGSQEGQSDAEFDPAHTMSPVRPGEPERTPAGASSAFSDGATPALPLEFALNSSSPTSSDGVVVVVEADPNQPKMVVAQQSLLGGGQPNYAALIDPKDSAR